MSLSVKGEQQEKKVVSVAIPRPLHHLFTYIVPDSLCDKIKARTIVKVPFGKSISTGFVVDEPTLFNEAGANIASGSLKEIASVVDGGSFFSEDVWAICKWAHEYYRCPLGEILSCAMPPAVLEATKRKKVLELKLENSEQSILSEEQGECLKKIEAIETDAGKPPIVLLHGVTGSGKTEVYIHLAKKKLQQGKSVLLLVPEIALTPQLHERFTAKLGCEVGLWHSALARGVRKEQFNAIRDGRMRVVVGARSAVFAPLKDLGLIVIDEEHEPSYKQEDRARYHARDLAIVRAKITSSLVVLGSATPSIETRERVREGRYSYVSLSKRYNAGCMPDIEIVDLCEEEKVESAQAPLAKKTITAIEQVIAAGNQAMVFLNRRGFASFLLCEECGEVPGCPNCSISLTMHKHAGQLRCHACGYRKQIPAFCSKCQGTSMKPIGAGTESLEEQLPSLIKDAKVCRLDRDKITSATRLERLLSEFRSGKFNVLLGTQMLVKGHDFPKVTLVVVVLADALFRWPDFRATERSLQILTQVAGRAGRGSDHGKVLIQTFSPSHPVLGVVQGHLSESAFLEQERDLRLQLKYPPFCRLARLRFEERNRDTCAERAETMAKGLREIKGIDVLGPSEAFLEKVKGIYRWDLLLKGESVGVLQTSLMRVREFSDQHNWQILVDVDPYGLG